MANPELLSIALVVLAILAVLLTAGVWIGSSCSSAASPR